jgi:hypothetical protein
LNILLKIQLLDSFDIEVVKYVYDLYKKVNTEKIELNESLDKIINDFENTEIKENMFHCYSDDYEKYFELEDEYTKNHKIESFKDKYIDQLDNIEFLVEIMNRFIISHTTKDCSILITFQQRNESIENKLKSENFNIVYGVVDLDLRYFKDIDKYYQQDLDVLKSFKNILKRKISNKNNF